MACSSLVDKLKQPIRLEPLSRFSVVRDLAVSNILAGFDQQCSSGLDYFLSVDRYGCVNHPASVWVSCTTLTSFCVVLLLCLPAKRL